MELEQFVTPMPRKSSVAQVTAFLERIGLSHYAPVLCTNGFDSLGALQNVQDAHLQLLGLPIGQRIRLLKSLKEAFPAHKRHHMFKSAISAFKSTQFTSGIRTRTYQDAAAVVASTKLSRRSASFDSSGSDFKTTYLRGDRVNCRLCGRIFAESTAKRDSEGYKFCDEGCLELFHWKYKFA